jgi:hypothetical protein
MNVLRMKVALIALCAILGTIVLSACVKKEEGAARSRMLDRSLSR